VHYSLFELRPRLELVRENTQFSTSGLDPSRGFMPGLLVNDPRYDNLELIFPTLSSKPS
jgi:hypothetical protein